MNIDFNISKPLVLELSKRKPYVSVLHLVLEWAFITALIVLSEYVDHIAFYLLSVVLIAARMHAIGTLAHEAVHYLLVKNKKWNDTIAELFITWPLFYSFKNYRKYHLLHHNYLSTEKDPDVQGHQQYPEFQFPISRSWMVWILIKDMLGINYLIYHVPMLFSGAFWKQLFSSFNGVMMIYYAIIGAIIFYFNLEMHFLIYWFIPFITWLRVIQRVRTIAEHNAVSSQALIGTRTTLTTFVDVIFFGPKNTNFHTEHHLYPSVPFYNLPILHQELMKSANYKNSIHLTKGYFNVIRECV